MSKIISIHSFRGGTGKSNVSANVSSQLAKRGFRVGVVDTDINSPGIHVLFQMDEDDLDQALNDYLWGRCEIDQAAYDVSARVGSGEIVDAGGALYLIPSSMRAGEITRVLRDGYDVGLLNDGFRDLIDRLNLDYLVIDTHPGLNEETLLSIAISDLLIIILRTDQQDFQGTAVTVDIARKLDVPRLCLVVNKAVSTYAHDNYTALRERIQTTYGVQVAAVIPLSEDIAALQSSDIFSFRLPPDHAASKGIQDLIAAVGAVE
jgi:MinD-like ATPase involved in chromosome partitioning or flagellar assembly